MSFQEDIARFAEKTPGLARKATIAICIDIVNSTPLVKPKKTEFMIENIRRALVFIFTGKLPPNRLRKVSRGNWQIIDTQP